MIEISTPQPQLDQWLVSNMVCPRDHQALSLENDRLICAHGHCFPCVEGIPIMLIEEAEPTHQVFAETLKISNRHYESIHSNNRISKEVHPFVQNEIVKTNGNLYRALKQNLTHYPIPQLPLQAGNGQYLLDIGCNWGRWSIAAARIGYFPVGIDPSLEAVLAARDVARQLGIEARFVVADCRYLPFSQESFDVIFSYSVLQHLSRQNVRTALMDAARVLKTGGTCLIQMPNSFGIRNLCYEFRQGFQDAEGFGVRYWSISQLHQMFTELIGPSDLSVDGFFSLNPQASDLDILPVKYRLIVRISEVLRKLSKTTFPLLLRFADSVYVSSRKFIDS